MRNDEPYSKEITLLHAKQMIDNYAAKNIFGNILQNTIHIKENAFKPQTFELEPTNDLKYQPRFDYIEAGTSNYKSQYKELTPKQKLMRSGGYFTERRKDNE